tara:strand:- start:2451 stop:2651 length:201 start_codon:yes stop_codon:yes gene_type:complete
MGRRKKNVLDSDLQTDNKCSKKDVKSKNTTEKTNIDTNIKSKNTNNSENNNVSVVPIKKKEVENQK